MKLWTAYLLALLALLSLISADEEVSVLEAFQKSRIFPDVYEEDDIEYLKVTYGKNEVELGNELAPTQTQRAPTVSWDCQSSDYFTLLFIDPDVPSSKNRTLAEFKHWMVGNSHCDIAKGRTFAYYVGPAPPLGTGFHRYVFLLFLQNGWTDFDEPYLVIDGSGLKRTRFSTRDFAAKYHLTLIAGNYFVAQYDDSVNATLTLLGF